MCHLMPQARCSERYCKLRGSARLMFGRCNICVASSDNVSPFLLNANSAGQRKHDQRYVRHEENKNKLVTFVTDNVLLVGIVGNKNCLARMLQDKRSGKAASREETKKVAMRQQ